MHGVDFSKHKQAGSVVSRPANIAHVKGSELKSGPGLQVNRLITLQVLPFLSAEDG